QCRNFGRVEDQIRFSGIAANGQSTRRKFERVIREFTCDKVQQQRNWSWLGHFTKGIDRVTSFGNHNREHYCTGNAHERQSGQKKQDRARQEESFGKPLGVDRMTLNVRVAVLGESPEDLKDPINAKERNEQK